MCVVVHSVIHFKTLQFPKWWKSFLQKSMNLNKRNLWQQQEQWASVYAQKKTKASQKFVILRRTINDKIANIVLLFLTLP